MDFSHLAIWKDQLLVNQLMWYKQVAENQMPAKYLIARKIPIDFNISELSLLELWEIHDTATNEFLTIWKAIRQDPTTYFELQSDDGKKTLMDLNVELINRMLKSCNFCQWNCNIDRTIIDGSPDVKFGTCQLGEESRVGSFFHHRGEELIFRGTEGSGTIFFTSCNMRCVFCQNGNISKDKSNGMVVNETDIATIAWVLRQEGCHNINYVGGDPTIHLHNIIRGISRLGLFTPTYSQIKNAKRIQSDFFINYPFDTRYSNFHGEFNVPQLWNSNFFMSEPAMKILRTVIDVWLPDFKFGPEKKCATTMSRTPWYWDTITRNHKLVYDWGESFVIRHLVMPNHVNCCTKPIFQWIKMHIPNAYVNIMDQYHPDSFTNPATNRYNPRYESINRRLLKSELKHAIDYANEFGINYKSVTHY